MVKADCPSCGTNGQVQRVIYYGLPHWLCDCDNVLFGFWSDLTFLLPFNGQFMVYEGPYLAALWYWLRGGEKK